VWDLTGDSTVEIGPASEAQPFGCEDDDDWR
jgi:hypothetical protein